MAAKLTLNFHSDPELARPIREALKGVLGAWGAADSDILDTQFAVSAAIETVFLRVDARDGGPVSMTMTALEDGDPPGVAITVETYGVFRDVPHTIPTAAPDWEDFGLYAIGRLMDEAAIVTPADGFRGWMLSWRLPSRGGRSSRSTCWPIRRASAGSTYPYSTAEQAIEITAPVGPSPRGWRSVLPASASARPRSTLARTYRRRNSTTRQPPFLPYGAETIQRFRSKS